MKACLLILMLSLPLIAAEPVGPASWLGLEVEELPLLDGGGLRVVRVAPGGTADQLGLRTGDLVTALDATQVPTSERFATALGGLRPGDPLRITATRAGAPLALSGTVAAVPRPRELLTDADGLRRELAALQADVARDRMRHDLQDALLLLQRLQTGLPQLASDFKKLYPTGTFSVQIAIDVRSDPSAVSQLALAPSATPAATATAAGMAATTAPPEHP